MHPVVINLLSRLSYGKTVQNEKIEGTGVVQTLARVYEKARNAMEYRADHLVRRAAIERILRRQTLFEKDPQLVTKQLMDELKWARYLAPAELENMPSEKLESILAKYLITLSETNIPRDWILGVASAEIEEHLNLNVDYNVFTSFAYQVMRQKVQISTEPNLDLIVFIAVDKVFSQSDQPQIDYHVLQLVKKQFEADFNKALEETYSQLRTLEKKPLLGRVSNYVRRQAVPLVLLRDIYFSNPSEFKNLFTDETRFNSQARKVLKDQLGKMSKRLQTAAVRSITYIFLTKMLFGIIFEAPIDILLTGRIGYIPLFINLLFPPLVMWAMSLNIVLPNEDNQQALIARSWQIMNNFEVLSIEKDALGENLQQPKGIWYLIFSSLYAAVFAIIFGVIFLVLTKLHFSFASQIIFVFFLTIVAFFAYRIRQTARIYSYKAGGDKTHSSLWDMFLLPILAVGNIFSHGLSKLNFLAFSFDFILEAPFKLILQFLDNWVQFLSTKKEEVIG